MTRSDDQTFGFLFLLLGIFALVGSLYTWGDGVLFSQPKNLDLLLLITDLVIGAPLYLGTAAILLSKRHQYYWMGIVSSGVLFYSSIAVYIYIFLIDNLQIELLIPPLFGILLGLAFCYWYHQLPRLENT